MLRAVAAVLTIAVGLPVVASAQSSRPATPGFDILVFSRTEGFRHASIADGLSALTALGDANNFTVTSTEDDAFFVNNDLSQFKVIVFLSTTGDVLDSDEESAFEDYIRSGGGFVGIHAAADTEYNWSWYGGLVGAYFASHPPGTPTASVKVVDRVHPATSTLPELWVRTDEWYNYQTNPRGDVHVLMTLDESTYSGGTMGGDHPIAWCHEYEGGRAFYTGGGHTSAAFDEPDFRTHLLNGILYAAGVVEGDCGATVDANFEKATLDDDPQNPMALEVAQDGRVFFVERAGRLRVYSPTTGTTTTAATLNVATSNEDGLLGIALDPDFATNDWIYLFYSPAGGIAKQHVSRFEMNGDALDLSSEVVLLEIPTQRNQCCHSAGELEFDGNGNLYVATGDNTNPFESQGFAPIDERAGRSAWDAQGTSGNAGDLRGKILRITPQPDGSYTIPAGNLFPSDGSAGLPEIYVMGVRNPFRFSIDPYSGYLYWGDVGPDASGANADRGPAGVDEWNQARAAGNFGWPYCIGPNRAYRDYNFATQTSGATFDCAAPQNDSPNNTGPQMLPGATGAWLWYPYGQSVDWPQIQTGNGRTAMGGPTYVFDDSEASDVRFPEYYDRSLILYEWSRSYLMEARLDAAGEVLNLQPFLGGFGFKRPISMKYGPDGALYLLEWGTGFSGNNNDASLVRIEYRRGSRSPVVFASADVQGGPVPLTVQFSSSGTFDPDPGDVLTYSWDFDGDTNEDSADPNPTHTYTVEGTFTAVLTVTDSDANSTAASVLITAGNTAPTVTVLAPLDRGRFDWGDSVRFVVRVEDPEDGSTQNGGIDCADVTVTLQLGPDLQGGPTEQLAGCDGVFETASRGDAGNAFHLVEAAYTDAGGLAGEGSASLFPKRLEVEFFDETGGVQVEPTADIEGGGQNIGFIEDGDWISFRDVRLEGLTWATYRVASAGPGGIIEMRAGATNGVLLGTAVVEPTGNWQLYRDVTAPIDDPGGVFDLFLVFRATAGTGGLFNVNWIDFFGRGIAEASTDDGRGLFAKYYTDLDFAGRQVTRTDPEINFNWGDGAPFQVIGSDDFSVRWAGFVETEFDEPYTFYARTSDGVRVVLDDSLIIDRWRNQFTRETASGAIELTSGRKYPIVVDYYEGSGEAQAHVFWSSPSTSKEIVPAWALTPDSMSTVSVEDPAVPAEGIVEALYPNPVGDVLTIEMRLETPGPVTIELVDLVGRRRLLLADSTRPSGPHRMDFDLSDLASGTYFVRVSTDGTAFSRVVSVVR